MNSSADIEGKDPVALDGPGPRDTSTGIEVVSPGTEDLVLDVGDLRTNVGFPCPSIEFRIER